MKACFCVTECWPDGPCLTDTSEPCPACQPHDWYRTRIAGNTVCGRCNLLAVGPEDYFSECVSDEVPA